MTNKPTSLRLLLDVYASSGNRSPDVALLTLDAAQIQALRVAEGAFHAARAFGCDARELVINHERLVYVARAGNGARELIAQLPDPLLSRFVREGRLLLPDDCPLEYQETPVLSSRLVMSHASFLFRARDPVSDAPLNTSWVPLSVLDEIAPPAPPPTPHGMLDRLHVEIQATFQAKAR